MTTFHQRVARKALRVFRAPRPPAPAHIAPAHPPSTNSQQHWDSQYAGKQWEYLKTVDELAHYSVIVGYYAFYKPGGSILDVGCGEGVLQERLRPHHYSRYLGIDLSAEAVRLAAAKQDAQTTFLQADANRYSPPGQFDVLIFNECLYYLDDPRAVLQRFQRALAPDGIFILSIYGDGSRIWNILHPAFQTLSSTTVSDGTRHCWTVRILKPAAPAALPPP